jgi:4-hydroxybenzoate polyprenyltransferase
MTVVGEESRASRRKGVVGLVVASHPGPTIAVTIAAVAYAVIVGRDASGVARVGVAVLFGQLTTGWQNDAIDAPRDLAAARSAKPIVNGLVTRAIVTRAAIVAGVICVVASYASGWRAGSVHVGAVTMALFYNAGLKRTAWSIVPYLVAFSLLPCFVTLGAPGSPLPRWTVIVGVALLGGAAHILNVLPDADADLLTNVRSLPHRLPLWTAWGSSGAALLASSALLAFGSGGARIGRDAAFIGCAFVGVSAVVAGSKKSPWGFRLACILAVADVGLLAASGR